MKHNGILGIVFVVGCATGGVAAQLVVPPVRAGTSPTRWEYQCVTVESDKIELAPVNSALNKLGAQGWQLVSIAVPSYRGNHDADAFTLCTKRELI